MSIGVSGGAEFVSAIHLRHSRFISTAVQAAASSKVVNGRPAVTDAARRTWPGGLPGVIHRQES